MMARMKHLYPLLCLVLPLLFFSPAQTSASAESAEETASYAVAATQDVWFYSEPDETSGLFILPYTYYVKVLSREGEFCAVEYFEDSATCKKLSGYCLSDALTFVDFVPERPYLYLWITITYSLGDNSGISVGGGAFDSTERSVLFCGTYYAGTARYYYVYADGVFDYVRATGEVVYELNTDFRAPSVEQETPAEPSGGKLSAFEIGVICASCAAAVVIALFVLRGKKASLPPEEQTEF